MAGKWGLKTEWKSREFSVLANWKDHDSPVFGVGDGARVGDFRGQASRALRKAIEVAADELGFSARSPAIQETIKDSIRQARFIQEDLGDSNGGSTSF